jgi:hypothetical protein
LIGYVQVYGEDDKALALDLDPFDMQDSYNKVDTRLTLANASGRWQLSLIGRNLTDKDTIGFSNDVNLFPGSHFGISEAPRTLILQGTLRY